MYYSPSDPKFTKEVKETKTRRTPRAKRKETQLRKERDSERIQSEKQGKIL